MQNTLFVTATAAALFVVNSVQAATVHLTPAQVQSNPAAIQEAMNQLQPGETLYLAGGVYEPSGAIPSYNNNTLDIRPVGDPNPRGRSGTASAWITVRNEPGQHPILRLGKNNRGGFALHNVSYWRVEGLELVTTSDANTYATGLAASGTSSNIQFVNNIVHTFGASGIAANDSSHILIEGNTVYDNCHRSSNGTSGINLAGLQMRTTDNSKFAGPLGNPGNAYAMIVRNNRVYYNRNLYPVSDTGGTDITDGNGIIVDYCDETGFTGKVLISNNVISNNGAAGVHVFKSSNVDVFHNTLYQNAWNSNGTQLSSFGPLNTSGVTRKNRFFNNIAVGGHPNIQKDTYINGGKTNGGNRGWQDGAGYALVPEWNKNLFYNTSDTSFPTGSIITDPRFVSAQRDTTSKPVADFRLLSNSGAINTGLSPSSTNVTSDHDYTSRSSSPDIGAYEFLSGTLTTVSTGGTAAASSTGVGHSPAYAFDNNTSTKWLGDNTSQQGVWLQYVFNNNATKAMNQYSITSANDDYGRDPRAWQIWGYNGTSWVLIDTRYNQWFTGRYTKNTYRFNNTTAYRGYALLLLQNSGSAEYTNGRMQLSEWALFWRS